MNLFRQNVQNRNEVDNHMNELCKSTCHDWTSKDEVVNYKEDIVIEKEELIVKQEKEKRKC